MAHVRHELALQFDGFAGDPDRLGELPVFPLDLARAFDELLLGAPPLEGVADRSLQQLRVETAFHQIVRRAGFHGLHVRFPVVVSGQQDNRRFAAQG
jgi:hypothetical protein